MFFLYNVVLPFIPASFPTCYILLTEEKSSSEEDSQDQSKSTKPMYLKDFERKELLEKGRFVEGVIVYYMYL